MTGQAEFFDRAAECGRLIATASDPIKKETWGRFRDMRIALANESVCTPADYVAERIADIENCWWAWSSPDLSKRRHPPADVAEPRRQGKPHPRRRGSFVGLLP
jgi:hypothetical protein